MASRFDMKNRKELLKRLTQKESEFFLKLLPMDKNMFQDLFDYLDNNLGDDDCHNNMTMTLQFLRHREVENRATVIQWFHDQGAYCDCKVLANVERNFRKGHNAEEYTKEVKF